MLNQQKLGFMDSIPVVTRNLLIINVLVFLAFTLLNSSFMLRYLALFYFKSPFFMPHQLITHMFMHGGFTHLFFNMFGLFMFGRTIETIWGPKRFLIYYMLTGIGAAIFHLTIVFFRINNLESMVSPDILSNFYEALSNGMIQMGAASQLEVTALSQIVQLTSTPMVGASGALYGILIAFGVMFPNAQLYIIPIPFPIKAKYLIAALAVGAIAFGLIDSEGDNVAHFAHLGGFVVGFILLFYWKKQGTLHGKFFDKH